MKIKFKHLKKISEGDDDYFISYLNRFAGDDIYEKFLNILKAWERDVSYDMGFFVDEKNVKVSLSYFIQEMENYDKEPIFIKTDNLEFEMNTPIQFLKNHDIFSLSETIKKVRFGDAILDFDNIPNKKELVEQLPASAYNAVINGILKNESKTIRFSNQSLKNVQINFMGNAPLDILKGLFHPYGDDYYRDIIYHLATKIGSTILMDSTMRDIDYYVEKMNQENAQEKTPDLG